MKLKHNAATVTGLRFTLNGSLHKYHNRGIHNADRFTFTDLQKSIGSLCDITAIAPDRFNLHGIEIGLNISLPFAPQRILKNLVSYGNRPFDQMDKKSRETGLQCNLQGYKLKIYDKGKQSRKGGNVLRFEVAIKKMATLKKYGIATLEDLNDPDKVAALLELLYTAHDKIIWTDTAANLNPLTHREQKKWLAYSNPKTWECMDKRRRFDNLKQWKNLLSKYGKCYNLKTAISDEWKRLFNGQCSQPNHEMKAGKNRTFYPLVYTGKKSCFSITDLYPIHPFKETDLKEKKAQKKLEKSPIQKSRFCKSCGSDISNQSAQSKFCSSKYVGKKKARQCRNKDSNKRLSIKRKINRAMKNDRFLQITYAMPDGQTYTDILHPKEIHLTKKWLDRVQTITKLKAGHGLARRNNSPPDITGSSAKEYLKSITESQPEPVPDGGENSKM